MHNLTHFECRNDYTRELHKLARPDAPIFDANTRRRIPVTKYSHLSTLTLHIAAYSDLAFCLHTLQTSQSCCLEQKDVRPEQEQHLGLHHQPLLATHTHQK